MRCVHEIKNKDTLCCARAIVVMREYAKKKSMRKELLRQWKTDEQKTEYVRRYEEIQKFQDYLGPMGYQLIGVEATRGGGDFQRRQI